MVQQIVGFDMSDMIVLVDADLIVDLVAHTGTGSCSESVSVSSNLMVAATAGQLYTSCSS